MTRFSQCDYPCCALRRQCCGCCTRRPKICTAKASAYADANAGASATDPFSHFPAAIAQAPANADADATADAPGTVPPCHEIGT